MSDPIVQLSANDYEDAIDFLNLVFGVYDPIDFEKLLPKLYRPTDEHMRMNYAIKRNGKIRAIVGLFPIDLHMGDRLLKVGGIGGVSVHPRDRGQGHMKRLMNHCIEVMRAEAYDLSWLGGQRQRYAYFGYEVGGTILDYQLTKTNLRHHYEAPPRFDFELVTEPSDPRIPQMLDWHDRQTIHCSRTTPEFLHIQKSWKHDLYAAMADGRPSGYVVADTKTGIVVELVAENQVALERLPAAWVAHQNRESVRFELAPVPGPLPSLLDAIAEYARVRSGGNWQVFNWKTVLEAALATAHGTRGLTPGEGSVEIAGYGRIEATVTSDGVSCTRSETAPDGMDPKDAVRLLFGPMPSWTTGLQSTLDRWTPLPLFMPRQDEV